MFNVCFLEIFIHYEPYHIYILFYLLLLLLFLFYFQHQIKLVFLNVKN